MDSGGVVRRRKTPKAPISKELAYGGKSGPVPNQPE